MSERFFPRDGYFMRLALREAERAPEHEDVPIGIVIVWGAEVIAAAHNERELRGDPTAHAEVLAIRRAAAHLRDSAARSAPARVVVGDGWVSGGCPAARSSSRWSRARCARGRSCCPGWTG